jgi:hypothetical protein
MLPKAVDALKIRPDYVMEWEVLAELYRDMRMVQEQKIIEERVEHMIEAHPEGLIGENGFLGE